MLLYLLTIIILFQKSIWNLDIKSNAQKKLYDERNPSSRKPNEFILLELIEISMEWEMAKSTYYELTWHHFNIETAETSIFLLSYRKKWQYICQYSILLEPFAKFGELNKLDISIIPIFGQGCSLLLLYSRTTLECSGWLFICISSLQQFFVSIETTLIRKSHYLYFYLTFLENKISNKTKCFLFTCQWDVHGKNSIFNYSRILTVILIIKTWNIELNKKDS